MSNAYIYRMPAGIAGDISRKEVSKVEPQFQDPTLPVTLYGVPVKIVSGKATPIASGDAASDVYGFSVRPYPIQGAASQALGVATPPTTQPIDLLRSGYMTVDLKGTTAAAMNGQVYVRIADGTVSQPIGSLEADADGGDCVAITSAKFMGAADADGNVEIQYNI